MTDDLADFPEEISLSDAWLDLEVTRGFRLERTFFASYDVCDRFQRFLYEGSWFRIKLRTCKVR